LEEGDTMQCKDRLESYLRGNDVAFQVQHHVRAFTAQEIASTEHVPGKLIAKVVMVIANGKTVMLAMPASHRVDLAAVRTYLEAADARLAHESEFAKTFLTTRSARCRRLEICTACQSWSTHLWPRTTQSSSRQARTALSLKYADYARLVQPSVAGFGRHR